MESLKVILLSVLFYLGHVHATTTQLSDLENNCSWSSIWINRCIRYIAIYGKSVQNQLVAKLINCRCCMGQIWTWNEKCRAVQDESGFQENFRRMLLSKGKSNIHFWMTNKNKTKMTILIYYYTLFIGQTPRHISLGQWQLIFWSP
jgi:hypothetical protein